MSEITLQQRNEVIDDLISYYQFLKKDTRNHFFNALTAKKRLVKNQSDIDEGELKSLNKSLLKIRFKYQYLISDVSLILRMKYDWKNVSTQIKIMFLGKLIWHYQENCLRLKNLQLKHLSRVIRLTDDENKIHICRIEAKKIRDSYRIIRKKLAITKCIRMNEFLKEVELDY